MRTNRTVLGEPVKRIDYAYMGQLKAQFRKFFLLPTCRHCEGELKEGDEVISIQKGGRVRIKIYHASCYEEMFH